jgi:DNA polymerase-3 subunit beta
MIYTKLSALRALANLAAKDDIRYYLNGLLIEANETTTRIVATNGHVMGIYDNTEQENETSARFIIPIDAVEMLKPAKNKLDSVCITIERNDAGEVLRGVLTVIGGASVNFNAVSGSFPDYTRVVPDTVTGETAQFNPDYIADFKKAYKLLGAKNFHIHHNGLSGAIVDFNMSSFLGIMMPLRTGAELATYAPARFKDHI